MRNFMKLAVLAVAALGVAGPAKAGNLVYLGQDPSYHWDNGQPGAAILGPNSATFAAGGASDPTVLAVSDGSFGENIAGMLNNAGFTHVTTISPAQLASTNLTGYQVLYVGPTASQTTVDTYTADSAQIQGFYAGGGGIVAEPEVFVTGAFAWAPLGAQLGVTGNNIGDESVHIVAPGHPVMANLTDASLSNWGNSVHNTFPNAVAAGFTVLSIDASTGDPVNIAFGGAGAVVPEPSTLVSAGLASLGALGFALRRRRQANA